jgi:hypothetical protein
MRQEPPVMANALERRAGHVFLFAIDPFRIALCQIAAIETNLTKEEH